MNWLNGFVIGLACGVMLTICYWLIAIRNDRNRIFVNHVQNHLDLELFPNQNAKVMCKICDRTIDEIYESEKK